MAEAKRDAFDPFKMHDLSDRVALVTGAASGIGRAAAETLAANGARVMGADITFAEVATSDGPPASVGATTRSAHLDVREEAHWQRALSAISDAWRAPDILVHAAGISSSGPIEDTSLAEWRRTMAVNLDGTFLALKHGIGAMRAMGGAIIVLGSAAGIRPEAGAAAYSTSKAALSMLVRSAAKECRDAEPKIRINTISPAGVKTPLWSTMPFFKELVQQHGSEEAAFLALDPEGQFAQPHQIAQVILFLVSEAASHITGVELPVDRGYVL